MNGMLDNLTPEELQALLSGFEAETKAAEARQRITRGQNNMQYRMPRNRSFGKAFLENFSPAAVGSFDNYQGQQLQKESNDAKKKASQVMVDALMRLRQDMPREQQVTPKPQPFNFGPYVNKGF